MSNHKPVFKEKLGEWCEFAFLIIALLGIIFYFLHWVYFVWQPFVHIPIFYSTCFLGAYIYCFKRLVNEIEVTTFASLFRSFKGILTFFKLAIINFIVSTVIATWLAIVMIACTSDWRDPDCNASVPSHLC